MENSRITDSNSKNLEQSLISQLLSGAIEVSDFRLAIVQLSKSKITNLFRDSFPKFTSGLKSRITSLFSRYFFNDLSYDKNEFWRFVDHKNLWSELMNFHDLTYSREMSFSDVFRYLEKKLNSTKSQLNLAHLEKKVIESLGKNPSSLHKTIADELGISEKKTSIIIKELKNKGIYLGSLISYDSVNLHEFFSFNNSTDLGTNAKLIDEYVLFPDFKIIHGIISRKKHGPSFHYVKDKKTFFNFEILTKGVSIKDWKEHPTQFKKSDIIKPSHHATPTYVFSDSQPHIAHLLRNCELDFKKPDIKNIADSNDVSARTLFRVKSKLIEEQVIQPNVVIENSDMLQLFIISKFELDKFYNKVPYINTFQVQDDFGDRSWISYLSIFIPDFKFIHSLLNEKTELFQVVERKIHNEIEKKSPLSLLHVNRNLYTN